MRYLPAILLIFIGLVVFALPHWIPSVSDVRVEPEAFKTAGQVGGGLIGVGVVFFWLAFFKSSKKSS